MSHRHRGRILPVLILSVQSVPLINKVMNAITSHLPIRRTLGLLRVTCISQSEVHLGFSGLLSPPNQRYNWASHGYLHLPIRGTLGLFGASQGTGGFFSNTVSDLHGLTEKLLNMTLISVMFNFLYNFIILATRTVWNAWNCKRPPPPF